MQYVIAPGEGLISKAKTKERIWKLGDQSSNDSICLIFGAGASFGYSEAHAYKPPIVRELFDESIPVVKKVINDKNNLFIKNNSGYLKKNLLNNYENDLERYLSYLYSNDREDNRFSNILAYLEDLFFLASDDIIMSEPNNYKDILNLMRDLHRKKEWSCLSFNYDTILEKSYLMTSRDVNGRDFSTLADYIDFNPAILKMHGGINFRYIASTPAYGQGSSPLSAHQLFSKMMEDGRPLEDFFGIIDLVSGKPVSKDQKSILAEDKKSWKTVQQYNYPLMLIPIHEAITPENTFFKNMLGLAQKKIENASLIVAIGYNFGDEAFLQKLSGIDFSKKEIILVNTATSLNNLQNHRAFQRVKKTWPAAKIKVFDGDGFKDFVEAIL